MSGRRRSSSYMHASVEQERALREFGKQLVGPADSHPSQLATLWESKFGFAADGADLLKKLRDLQRIDQMIALEKPHQTNDNVSQQSVWNEEAKLQQLVVAIVDGKKDEFAAVISKWAGGAKASDMHSRTLLHHAAINHAVWAGLWLLDASDADPNAIDGEGNLPLHYALRCSGEDSLQARLIRGVKDPNLCNARGDSPLHIACYYANTEAVKELLQRGADVNGVNALGQTPLHIASHRAGHDVIKILLDAGANAEAVDGHGNHPHIIAERMRKRSNASELRSRLIHAMQAVRAAVRMKATTDPNSPYKKSSPGFPTSPRAAAAVVK